MQFPVLTKGEQNFGCVLFPISVHFPLIYLILDTHLMQSLYISAQDLKNLFLIKQGGDGRLYCGFQSHPVFWISDLQWDVQGSPLECEWAVNK